MVVAGKTILLVEDNPDGELLTRRALKKNNVCNDVVVARDGAEALDYLFATGEHAGRDPSVMPQVVLSWISISPSSTGWRSSGASGPRSAPGCCPW
jgi:CheY-like chemotaxis protein